MSGDNGWLGNVLVEGASGSVNTDDGICSKGMDALVVVGRS